jgi:hypothetical protein
MAIINNDAFSKYLKYMNKYIELLNNISQDIVTIIYKNGKLRCGITINA